jgi:hypothetical protein
VIQFQDFKELLQLSAQGAGIFITVNETDEQGRKKENITRVRAVFQEDDDGFDGAFPLEPSIVVETSPGHTQRPSRGGRPPLWDEWSRQSKNKHDESEIHFR